MRGTNPPHVQEQVDHAKLHHTSRYERELMECDCGRCWGKGVWHTYSTVKKHRGRYPRASATNNENRSVSRRLTPTIVRSLRGSPSLPVRRVLTPKPYEYGASPRLSHRGSLLRSPLSQIASNATNSPARSLRGGSAAPPSSPTACSPMLSPVQSAPPPTPVVDMRRLLGAFMRSYPPDRLLGTPSTIPTCSPGIRPPSPMNTQYYAPHLIWDLDIYGTPPPRPRSPSLVSIDSNAPPSEHGDNAAANEQDFWGNLLNDEERHADPPRLFDDGDRVPEFDQRAQDFLGDLFDDPPQDDDPPQGDDQSNDQQEPQPDGDEPPIFEGFFRDLDAEPDDAPPNDHPCVAFDDEPDDFRNIMIRVYLLSAFSGVTNEAIAEILTTHKMEFRVLEARGELSEQLRTRLPFFPETLRTLQNRLGMDIDDIIKIFALCPSCGTLYGMEYINRAPHHACIHLIAGEECGEPIFKETRLYGNTRKRIPYKSFPYLPLPQSLERNLVRPGFPEIIQMWRRPGDESGNAPPATRRDWMERLDRDAPLKEMWDGWGWRNLPVGLDRYFDEETGRYGDVPTGEIRSLARLPLGLNLSINIDGFQVFKRGKYSVQGVYIVINNLPLQLRTRHENMILAMVMPGPKEPSSYEYNQMLQPLVDDVIALGKGMELWVHRMELNRCEKQLVHAALSSQIVDYISRIKTSGHTNTSSHLNFCLYCKTKRYYLSVRKGFQRDGLHLRDPQEYLQHKHDWLVAPKEDQEDIRLENGTTFVEMDRIPGFFCPTQSPIDAMHMFDLNMSPWIFKDILLDAGMFKARHSNQTHEETPEALLDAALGDLYLPSSCARILTSVDKITSRTKAEQWKNITSVLHILLFKAWKVGDTIPDIDIPRGNKTSIHRKEQERQAKLLLAQRLLVHLDQEDDEDSRPTLGDCAASRNAREYYRNILRFVVAISILSSRDITPNELEFAQRLLERLATSFTEMNVHLSPTFHYSMHIAPFVLKYGSMYNTWCYPFECANLQLQTTNHNGHGLGVLESTFARGYLKKTGSFHILKRMQDIQHPTLGDNLTIAALCKALQHGPEYERQRGMLAAILAEEANFRGRERIRLASTIAVDLSKKRRHHALLVGFCNIRLPSHVVYGYGNRPHGGIYLNPKTSVESASHLLHCGIRFGEAKHYRGNNSRFGFVRGNIPVIIRKIYQIQLETPDEE